MRTCLVLFACLSMCAVAAAKETPTQPSAPAIDLPRVAPEKAGLSKDDVATLDRLIQSFVEKKATPGAVVSVCRKGKVAYLKSFGAFKQDSIFRIYSMTKPIAVVAALMLVDDGKLALDDPVSKYIPELGELTVHGSEKKPGPITVQHLMQHTAGMTYGLFGNTPVDQAYRKADVLGAPTLEEMGKRVAKLPLLFEPGGRWHYSVSIDILGRVVEVVAKKPFDEFLRERLFEPLGMKDTAFHVPDDKIDRFLACYNARCDVIEAPGTSRFRKPPGAPSGGGGLVSTIGDYTKFLLMVANGGTWDGKRYLKAETVERMTTNQLPSELIPIRMGLFPLPGMGFGLGVAVRVKATGNQRSVGAWGWGGAASTTFLVDPAKELIVVCLIQRMPMWMGLDNQLRTQLYSALTDEPETSDASKSSER